MPGGGKSVRWRAWGRGAGGGTRLGDDGHVVPACPFPSLARWLGSFIAAEVELYRGRLVCVRGHKRYRRTAFQGATMWDPVMKKKWRNGGQAKEHGDKRESEKWPASLVSSQLSECWARWWRFGPCAMFAVGPCVISSGWWEHPSAWSQLIHESYEWRCRLEGRWFRACRLG